MAIEYFGQLPPWVLGLVAQSGGIPTGGLIERGANANGEYVRFADGTQICTQMGLTATFLNVDMLSATWVFPAVFIAIPCNFCVATNLGADYTGVARTSLGYAFTTYASVSTAQGGWVRDSAAPAFAAGNSVAGTRMISIGRWF